MKQHKLFITGDIHGQIDIAKINKRNWPEQFILNRNDYLLQLGDLGLIWQNDKTFKYLLDFYTSRKYTLLWIDGNHSFSKNTELLTTNGWKNIVECYNNPNIELANFNINTRQIYFNKPSAKYKHYEEYIIKINAITTKQLVSSQHSVVINNTYIPAEDLLGKKILTNQIPICGIFKFPAINISNDMIRLITWIACSGKIKSKHQSTIIQFKLSTQNKINVLFNLLKKLNINFSILSNKKTYIKIIDNACILWNLFNQHKYLPDWFKFFNQDQFKIFLNELSIINKHLCHNNTITLISSNKHNIDLIQEMCIYNNWKSYYHIYKKESLLNTKYKMVIVSNIPNKFVHIEKIKYNDYTYCFTMPRGTLISRYNGKIAFTGNSNHTWLNTFPIIQWNGGNAHKIADNIFHLMRGEVYNIYNKTFFTFGGGLSIDKNRRTAYVNWWPEEEANYQEQMNAINNLERYNYKINYILTHSAPELIKNQVGFINYTSNTEQFLQYINDKLIFDKWFIGHYHIDNIYQNYYFLYNKILNI